MDWETLLIKSQLLVTMAIVSIAFPSTVVDSMRTGRKLTDDIINYEPVFYNSEHLHRQHHRSKRADHPVISLDFSAFGRTFNISLHRDRRLFSSKIQIETSNQDIHYDLGRAYIGYVLNQEYGRDSTPSVRGIITTKGHFQGTISTPSELYIVEPASKYFQEHSEFHSVIFKASDVKLGQYSAFCGTSSQRKSIKELQKKIKNEKKDNRTNPEVNNFNKESDWVKHDVDSDWAKHDIDSDWTKKYLRFESKRHRRAVSTKTTCEMYMQADHLYFQQHGSDVEAVIEELSRSVQTVNSIYSIIDFDGDGTADNINFVIKRIKVHTDPTDPEYKLNGNFGVEKFLELHSEENYDPYCLSYIFTHRDFDGGTLGLAWTAGEDQSGGLCDKFTSYSQGSLSLNTGLVTTLNYGKVVSSHVVHLTLAHEIGHNFGSEHDTEGTNCSPGGTNGNYIMYARATSGDLYNNDKFSSCSITAMAPFIETRGSNTDGCFVESVSSICGNKVVEPGEACDCGYEADCTESCCNPQTDSPGGETPCTIKDSSVCSPSSGPCCDNTCQFITSASNTVCRSNTSCLEAATCTGSSAECPASTWKANKTPCEDDQVCINGTCSGSACLKFEFESCQCTPTKPGDWRDEKLCAICCLVDGQCKPSHEIDGIPNGTTVPGSPCNNYQGYCDVFYRCREVDPTGTFSTIRKLLSPASLATIKEWLTKHWYVPVLAGLGFIVLMVVFVKVCGKRIPSDKELYEKRMRNYGNGDTPLSHRPSRSTVAPTGYM